MYSPSPSGCFKVFMTKMKSIQCSQYLLVNLPYLLFLSAGVDHNRSPQAETATYFSRTFWFFGNLVLKRSRTLDNNLEPTQLAVCFMWLNLRTILYSSLYYYVANCYLAHSRYGRLILTPLKMVVEITPDTIPINVNTDRRQLISTSDVKSKIDFKVETSAILNVCLCL